MCQIPPINAPPTATSGHQGAPCVPETPSPLPAPQHSSDSSQHMPGFPGTWHSHGPHPEPTYRGQGFHQLPAAGLVLGLFPAKHWLHASDHMGFLWEGLVPCFSAFSVVAKTLPVPRNGPSSNWGCQGATAVLQGWLFRRFVPWHTAPPRAFLGLTRRLEPGQAGRGGEQDTLRAPNDTRAAAGPWHRHIPPVQPRGNRTHQTRRVWS